MEASRPPWTGLRKSPSLRGRDRRRARRLLLPELFAVRCSARARMNERTVSSAQHSIVASDRGAATTPVWARVLYGDPLGAADVVARAGFSRKCVREV